MAKEEQGGQKKLTYDELMKAAQDLNTQNNYLKTQAATMQQKIIELSNFTMFKRLDYLFEVIKNAGEFPNAFVQACREEIVDTMTPPAEPEETKEEEQNEKTE